jgi:hypothetical protein
LDFLKTTIASDIELHRFVVAMLPTIPIPILNPPPLPLPLPLPPPRMRLIFVVGDETVFALAWRKVNVAGEDDLFVPVYISQLDEMA